LEFAIQRHQPVSHSLWKNGGVRLALSTLAASAAGTVWANSPCDLVTRAEASRLLGVSAGKKVRQKIAAADTTSCLINSANEGHDTLKLAVTTVSREETTHLREHTDDERGDEVQSMHGEPWYEVSIPDPEHPQDHRLVIHRDRMTLTLDLHSSHQTHVKQAFESVWYKIAERLPSDETDLSTG
jgi:hypothetical protein